MKIKCLSAVRKTIAAACALSMIMTGSLGTVSAMAAEAETPVEQVIVAESEQPVEAEAEQEEAAVEQEAAEETVVEETTGNELEAVSEAAEEENADTLIEVVDEQTSESTEAAEDEEAVEGTNLIDVYDISGKQELDTKKYKNHITGAILAEKAFAGSTSSDGTLPDVAQKNVAKDLVFDDLTLSIVQGSDRIYSAESEVKAYTQVKYAYTFEDKYSSNGGWYLNGAAKPGTNRYALLSNVKAGDTIVCYINKSKASDGVFHFINKAGGQDDSEVTASKKYVFVAEKDGDYYLVDGGASDPKPVYSRIMRYHGVAVSGTIDLAGYTGKQFVLVNQDNMKETVVNVNADGTFNVTMAPGFKYRALLRGTSDYGTTNASRDFEITADDSVAGSKSGIKIVCEKKEVCTYSGKLVGLSADDNTDNAVVVFTPDETSGLDVVYAPVDTALSFSAALAPENDYVVTVEGLPDYVMEKELKINIKANTVADIKLVKGNMYKVTGSFVGLDGEVVEKLQLKNIEDGYVYTAAVNDMEYSANLRNGKYEVIASVAGFSTSSHVVVDGKDVSKDILFVSTKAKETLPLVKDIYVGFDDKENNYDTVQAAVDACAQMAPKSEADRITVHIAPGTYREQITIGTPYITFVNDTPNEQVLLTWYYGVDYAYYSAGSKGFYDKERAFDKYSKNKPDKWGVCTYLLATAKGFKAENIVFENSFNRYITEEELEDGVELVGAEGNAKVQRVAGMDVTAKPATERACAMAIYSDQVEFNNCQFLGSQDTLFTGNANYHVYFKDCFITGMTDYIFGDADCVFDTCELQFCGYSTGALGGYITAAKPSANTKLGYLFRNCVVTANSKLQVPEGYLGRNWGADARVLFYNTIFEKGSLINEKGWVSMGGPVANSNFNEYGTTTMTGEKVDLSKREAGKYSAEDPKPVVTDYFGTDWTPSFYVAPAETVALEGSLEITDNGDLNLPKPGHTLTAAYSLGEKNDKNDISVIKWYSNDELVKTSVASLDKTYKIQQSDVGHKIKVEVTPKIVSGATAAAVSFTMEEVVGEGYDDPSNPGGTDLGDGVNIFLAGDSTVKDYSTTGMYMSTKAGTEGSWGEFLQLFFDKDQVRIQDYANGGRSSRTFYDEGTLDKIIADISEGDYLFIQFGHNDCASQAGYEARYTKLGDADSEGKFPTTLPTGKNKNDGTYKGYLKVYIDAAKEKGAIPVLVTPVSRMYYNGDGTIKPHHTDSVAKDKDGNVAAGDTYVEAVKQLAAEEDVLCIDFFDTTKSMFEEAYQVEGSDALGYQLMNAQTTQAEKTHNNKLGGVIWAGLMAQEIQNTDLPIAAAVKAPSAATGMTPLAGGDVKTFELKADGTFKGYNYKTGFTEEAAHWSEYGSELFGAIAAKADTAKKFSVSVNYVAGSDKVGSVTLASRVSSFSLKKSAVESNVPEGYKLVSAKIGDKDIENVTVIEDDTIVEAVVEAIPSYEIKFEYSDGTKVVGTVVYKEKAYGDVSVRLSAVAANVPKGYKLVSAKIGETDLTSSKVVSEATVVKAVVAELDKTFTVSANYVLEDGTVIRTKTIAKDVVSYKAEYDVIAATVGTGYEATAVKVGDKALEKGGSVDITADTTIVVTVKKAEKKPDPVDPTDPTDPSGDEEVNKTVSENATEMKDKKFLTNKDAAGDIEASLATDKDGKTVDTVALKVSYAKKKATAVTPTAVSGNFTVAAGTKITLPGVDAGNKNQTYTVKQTDGTVVDTANAKLKDKNIKIAKGVVTTKANKKDNDYSFEVSYSVDNKNYSYAVTVINIGFKKEYKKTKLKAEVPTAENESTTKAVINLNGDLLGTDADSKVKENTITSAVWVIGKDLYLVPGQIEEIKDKAGNAYATVQLSADGKSLTVKSTGKTVTKGTKTAPVTGKVAITAYVQNAKKLSTAISIVK